MSRNIRIFDSILLFLSIWHALTMHFIYIYMYGLTIVSPSTRSSTPDNFRDFNIEGAKREAAVVAYRRVVDIYTDLPYTSLHSTNTSTNTSTTTSASPSVSTSYSDGLQSPTDAGLQAKGGVSGSPPMSFLYSAFRPFLP